MDSEQVKYSDTTPIFHIEIDKIKPNPLQPRKDFSEESLKELAASISEFGILHPLVVTKLEKETPTGTDVEYQLLAGERRWMAAKMIGWERVPVIIRNIGDEHERLEMAIIENVQRADLNPLETARAYARLQEEFRFTQREIAARIGKSRESVANTLRLLTLPPYIQDALNQNQISESHARALLMIDDIHRQQLVFNELLRANLSVRELRRKVAEVIGGVKSKTDPEMQHLMEQLEEALGTRVKVRKSGDRGKITIDFYSQEELDNILKKIIPPEKSAPGQF